MKRKYALWTNDVETHSIWLNDLNIETGRRVVREGIPKLLDIYDELGIKSTFFFNCDIAKPFPDAVRAVHSRGHEIGSHGLTHDHRLAFDTLSYQEQSEHLKQSKRILEDAIGEAIVSFRAPALRVNDHTPRALVDNDYLIDSSVASQRFDFMMSFGAKSKLKWLTAPRRVYKTKDSDLSKMGSDGVIEVPLSALIIPYVGTVMRISPILTKGIRAILNYEQRLFPSQIVFDIHPNEMIEESDRERSITRRSSSYIQYVLADVVRSKMKIKNLGDRCTPIYIDNIRYFRDKGYRSVSLKHYCTEIGLLK
ncbi:MAG: polysaccharide deacetylase family protein [Bacilli bacterium]|jgi:peptidoglycan/xylan/chitin deacetylase (PgdA/CDA1 family)